MYKKTQNLLKISDKTDGNFVQLHKHTQGTEQCICLKKALQTSQGAPACAPCIIPFSSSLPFSSFSPFRALSVYTKKAPYCLMISQFLRCAQDEQMRVLCHTERSEVSQFRAVAGQVFSINNNGGKHKFD